LNLDLNGSLSATGSELAEQIIEHSKN